MRTRVRGTALLTLILFLLLTAVAPAGPGIEADLRGELSDRRASLADHIDEGTLVLFGPSKTGLRDTGTEPNFFYLSGLSETGSALVVTISRPATTEQARRVHELARLIRQSSRQLRNALRRAESPHLWTELSPLLGRADRATRKAIAATREGRGPAEIRTRLYLRPHSPQREKWEGPTLFPGPEAARATGLSELRPIRSLIPDLDRLEQRSILYLLGSRDDAPAQLQDLLARRPDLEVRSVRDILARLRAVKSPAEISRIRTACELTARGLLQSMQTCSPGMAEFELQAVLEFACRRGGARRQAFDSIVASGPNATILHYRKNERIIRDGDLVLMDVGAEYRGYAADITRTFPANGRFTEAQARVYDVVLKAQQAAIDAVRPGATLGEIRTAAREVIKAAGLDQGWRHAISHHVGLEVHDPGVSGRLREGMVFTVEPGLYFKETEQGIRIEDTVVVTADGCEVLSAGIPKDRAAIETIMAERPVSEERER